MANERQAVADRALSSLLGPVCQDGRDYPERPIRPPPQRVAHQNATPAEPDGALGILESFNVATLIQGADAAAKAAAVTLLEIRLAMALGGKAFVTMTGDIGSVQSAMAAGGKVISDAGVLVNAVVLSRPHPDVYREVI